MALRVRQVAVIGERPGARSVETVGESSRSCNKAQHSTKPPPVCFVCNDLRSKHFLTDCEQFKSKTPEQKRKTVIDAARCFNCLSLGHFSRECRLLLRRNVAYAGHILALSILPPCMTYMLSQTR